MFKNLTYIFLILITVSACDSSENDAKETENSTQVAGNSESSESGFVLERINFSCGATTTDENGIPSRPISALFNGKEVKISTVNNCNALIPGDESGDKYNVDPEAQSAMYSLHDGKGVYFYAKIEDGEGVIYRAQRDGDNTDPLQYKVIGRYNKEGYNDHSR